MQEFVTHSREETVAVGRELAKTLPAGTLPLQPIYGQSQYTRPSSALGRGLGHLQSPR